MSERDGLEVTSIHFDVKTGRLVGLLPEERAIQFTLRTNPLRLTFDGMFHASDLPGASQRLETVHEAPQTTPTPEKPTGPERQPVQTLTGRLKDDVKPGRNDSRGNPTSWSIAAVHEEGKDEAKMISVSFHRHTTQLALDNLKKDDQIVIQGYLRPSNDPARMDAFSAFHLINYPGKEKEEQP
jgi:hypothetical protein